MAKKKNLKIFSCTACGSEYTRWAGKCDACGEWNTLEESDMPAVPVAPNRTASANDSREKLDQLPLIADIPPDSGKRQTTGQRELDLVLGGGLVAGSFILIGGEPGVGKSTLMLEIARKFSGKIYYFSGEESTGQIKLRADRMGLKQEPLYVSRETDLEQICRRIMKEKPALVVIDSIQTVYRSGLSSVPGSVSQLKEAAALLMETSKATRIPLIVTGHITKDGAIAGPRLLEHLVDVVLYFESDRLNHYRILRAVKNRFGPVGEVAIFEMHKGGLRDGVTPGIARSETPDSPGRVYSALAEGSRAIGVEVQALVTRSSYGPSRRMAEGLDNTRLILISAVLEKYLKLNLAEYDIFANLAGGLSAGEPALDLALCAAVISSYKETPLPNGAAFLGEVGLSGEVRPVSRILGRIKELKNLGFHTFYVPLANMKEIEKDAGKIIPIEHVSKLLGMG